MEDGRLIQSIRHVQVSAPPNFEDAMRAFYADLLGLTEIPKPEILRARGGVWCSCGALEIHVGVDAVPDNRSSRRHVALQAGDLNEVREALARGGIDVEEDQAPLDAFARLYCRDPAGNRVEFVQ
jgi:catechol 2,3-dioxygenase-like lactoylglutathione lyase family enzyme